MPDGYAHLTACRARRDRSCLNPPDTYLFAEQEAALRRIVSNSWPSTSEDPQTLSLSGRCCFRRPGSADALNRQSKVRFTVGGSGCSSP